MVARTLDSARDVERRELALSVVERAQVACGGPVRTDDVLARLEPREAAALGSTPTALTRALHAAANRLGEHGRILYNRQIHGRPEWRVVLEVDLSDAAAVERAVAELRSALQRLKEPSE